MDITKNRIVSLDIAKAICIILVVVGHYIPDSSPEWYKLIHDVIYTFHMPLFDNITQMIPPVALK